MTGERRRGAARPWPRRIAGAAAGAAAVSAAVWLLQPSTSASRAVAANLSLLLAPVSALAAAWGAGSRTGTPARRSWWLLALGSAAAVLGQAAWMARELVLGTGIPFPSEAFVLFVAFHLLVAAAAVAALRPARSPQLALEIALDGILVLLMAALLGLRFLLEPPVVNGWLSGSQAASMLGGLVATAASTFFVVLLLIWRDTDLPQRSIQSLAAAVALFLCGNILTASGLDPRPSDSGDPVELIWLAGWLLVAGAAFFSPDGSGVRPEPRESAARRIRHLVIPLTVAFLVLAALDAVRRPYFTTASAILLLALGVVLAARVVNALRATEQQAERRRQAEVSAMRARVRAMVTRLRPHFVLNSLNAVAELVRRGDGDGQEAVYRLASLIRYTLEAGEDRMVTLGQELRLTREYLRLERLRMGDRLTVRISVSPSARERPVPPFVLQPLVENAVRHGLATRVGGGTVRVRGRVRDGMLMLEVADDGVGALTGAATAMKALGEGSAREWPGEGNGWRQSRPGRPGDRGSGRGIGLRGVRAQLRAHYGDTARIRVRSRPGHGFVVRLWIPDTGD
ncbi:MAG TPA: histidine kinase [Longimicrobiales bacterium]|nr:histidine kinase [Longimicrobiales bacterium]